MTLPGDVANSNQRGSMRYRLYTSVELDISAVNLNAGATATGRAFCTEGFCHFQMWVSTTTLPSTFELYVGGFHPALNEGTFTNMLVGTVTVSVASESECAYWGANRTPGANSNGGIWRVGRFARVAVKNTGAALAQAVSVYVEATG